ncbi:MAG: hypothetical protein KKI01_10070 [Proteobacteria bacterium]|nr:hypothetical protein [Pseudomonadota bacterium]
MKLRSIGDALQRIQNIGPSDAEAEALTHTTAQAAYDEVAAEMRQRRTNEVERARSQKERDDRQTAEATRNKARHEQERIESLARTEKLKSAENVKVRSCDR